MVLTVCSTNEKTILKTKTQLQIKTNRLCQNSSFTVIGAMNGQVHHIRRCCRPLPMINIDTDMIIPKQFLKTIKRTGLGVNLFDEMRYKDDGSEIEDFVLNKPHIAMPKFL